MIKTKEEALNSISKLNISMEEFEFFKNDKEVVLAAVKQNGYALQFASDELKNDRDVLNMARDYLMSDKWVGGFKHNFFFKSKENLLKYDAQDKREKELLSKLADLDKLQAQQQISINQPKAVIKARRKI